MPKTWDELLAVGKKLTNDKRFGVLFETDARLLPELHLVSLHVAGRRRVPDEGRQERVQFARRRPGAEVLAGRGQQGRRAAASRWAAAAGTSVPNLGSGYCAMQNVGIWAIAQLREGAPDFKYGVFKLPTPAGGKYVTVGGGWAFVANAKGANPRGGRRSSAPGRWLR